MWLANTTFKCTLYSLTTKGEYYYKGREPYKQLIHTVAIYVVVSHLWRRRSKVPPGQYMWYCPVARAISWYCPVRGIANYYRCLAQWSNSDATLVCATTVGIHNPLTHPIGPTSNALVRNHIQPLGIALVLYVHGYCTRALYSIQHL